MCDTSARTVKTPKSAKLTKASEPIAKPLPMAAVVLPAASKQSVRPRTSAMSYVLRKR